MHTLRTVTLCLTCTLLTSLAHAHELWLQPMAHVVNQSELIKVTIMHGERFQGNPVARNSPMIRRYELVHPDHEAIPVAGLNTTVEGYIRPANEGVIVYHTKRYESNLPAQQFTAYLREEGLGEIERRREALSESQTPGREVYSRCAKSVILLDGGSRNPSTVDHDTGLPLEIILKDIDTESDTTRVQALIEFDDAPIAGISVIAVSKSDPERLIELTSDAEGSVRFDATPGDWMITTLHIERATEIDNAEWESYWASSTFTLTE